MSQYTQKVNTGMNDAYKAIGGSWWNALNIINVGDDVEGFVRFTNVGILSGATIDSAYLTIVTDPGSYYVGDMYLKVRGIDEDNTADFTSDASGKDRTTANVDWDIPNPWGLGQTYVSPDIKTIIQEIIDRPGWESLNALALVIENDGSTINNAFQSYEKSTSNCAYLEINFTGTSTTTKTIICLSLIRNPEKEVGIIVSKPTYPVTDTNPSHLIFNSNYGTLKYFTKGNLQIYIDGDLVGNLDSVGTASIQHNLGYIPYCEVYMESSFDTGNYIYCPTFSGGASVTWEVLVNITTTHLTVYVVIAGFTTQPTFYFNYFIFRNDLGL